jgi:hypothetical protein
LNCRKFPVLTLALLATATIVGAQTGTNAASPSASQSGPGGAQSSSAPGTPSSPSAPLQSAPTEAAVPPDATVITINGVCDVSLSASEDAKASAKSATATKSTTGTRTSTRAGAVKPDPSGAVGSKSASSVGDCKTQITRAQFEKLLKTAAPTAPPSARRQIAARFVQFFTAANEGVKLGVEKDPDFPEQLALMRLQLLAQDAEKKLQTQAADVSEADEKNYYGQNPSAFEEVTLTRIFVPRTGAAPASSAQGQTSPDAEAIAKDARQQLASGIDPEKVKKSVYDQLKNTTTPPTTKFGAKRRGTLPPAHEQKVFEMKPGEVSDVISDSVGYVVYRVDSRQELPFDQVKDDIKRKITQQRMEDARQQILNASKADFNDSYFGPEAAPPKPPSLGGTPPSLRPGAAGVGSGNVPPGASPNQSQQQSQPATPKK